MFCAAMSYAILPYVCVLGVVECLCAHTVHTHIHTAHAHTHGQMTATLVRIRPRSQEDYIPRPPPPPRPPLRRRKTFESCDGTAKHAIKSIRTAKHRFSCHCQIMGLRVPNTLLSL